MNLLQAKGMFSLTRTALFKALEFSVVSLGALFLLSRLFFHLGSVLPDMPAWLDRWYMCYVLELQAMRILGLNPGGLWEGGLYYPFHADNLLFDEPSWGVSLLVAPFWRWTQNIFPIYRLGGIPALVLAWIFTYYFVKRSGGSPLWAFCAAALFCLSGVSLDLITQQYCFWPFFLIPLLGIITLKIFSSPKLYWGILWGAVFGFLAWSSAHLFVMGGCFLGFLVLWHLLFRSPSQKALVVLGAGVVLSGLIASGVLIPLYLTHEKYGFFRDYFAPHFYASNLANLFYKQWPPPSPFNLLAKTPLWDWLRDHAKGASGIGLSVILFCGAVGVFFARLWEPVSGSFRKKNPAYYFFALIIASGFFAFLNMYALTHRCAQLQLPPPELAIALTYSCYVVTAIFLYVLRHRILSASKHLDFFLIITAIFSGILAFGPYYVTGGGQVVASPVAFLVYLVPGISGLQATARWGLLLSFSLSAAVAVFLSRSLMSRLTKILVVTLAVIALFEASPGLGVGLPLSKLLRLPAYHWTPRETDIFLRGLPGNDAVLELSSYPAKREQQVTSVNSLGYVLFSRLYHKKKLVTGYGGYVPHVIYQQLFDPENPALSFETVNGLRKFGARYWVLHVEDWSPEEVEAFKKSAIKLRPIAELDKGKTLIYEDPEPAVSVDLPGIQ